MPNPPAGPRITITLKRSPEPDLQLPVYVRDVPGMLAPPPPSTGGGFDAIRPERVEDAHGGDGEPAELEIDPLALRNLASLRGFLGKVAELGRPVELWCWDARLQRLLTITDAAADATSIEIDLTT